MSRRLFVWLIASLAIHTGLTAVGLAALRGVAPPALFVDLVHDLLGADAPLASGGRARGAEASAGAGGGQSPNAALRARPEHPAASPSTPRPPLSPAPPTSPAPRAETSEPLTAHDPSPPRDLRPAPERSPTPERPPLMAVEPARTAPEPAVALPLPVLEIAPTAPLASGPAAGATREGVVGTSTPATGPASASPGTPGRDQGGRSGGSGDGPSSGAGVGAHEGGALVLAVPGAGGDGAGEYGTYLALLRRRIGDVLSYPPTARRRGLAGTVQIELEIQATGAISHVAVVASSSHRLLDDAAVEAVHGLGRLPFPAGVPPRHLRVRLPVVFDLR
jgi:periplasmic protein TonB